MLESQHLMYGVCGLTIDFINILLGGILTKA